MDFTKNIKKGIAIIKVCCTYKMYRASLTYLSTQENTDEHTSGCLIVGETQQDLDISKDGFIGHSGNAYTKLYDKVVQELLQGNDVTIEYTTITKLLNGGKTIVPKKRKKITRFVPLKKGDKGKKVKELQTMLNIISKTFINIDGDYGNKTLAAVVNFQKKYKLKTRRYRRQYDLCKVSTSK